MTEVYQDIPGYEGLYIASNLGQVKREGKTLKWQKNLKGYYYVALHKDGTRHNHTIHRIVASLFIGNPLNLPEINHKDRDKRNNSENNLEWVNKRENQTHYQDRDNIGSTYDEQRGKFLSRIWIGKKSIHLGYHDTAEQASEAYRQAVKHHGLINRYADR